MLRLRCTEFRYPAARSAALHEIDLEIPHGAIVGLVGPNEAGKSTLCLVASGMAPAVVGGGLVGTLEIDGQTMTGRPAHELAERVGLGAGSPARQLTGLAATVFEEVAIGPLNLGLSAAEAIERVEEALLAVGIAGLAGQHPRRLSGGESQLVAIASLLAMRPSHLILDEPTSELDPIGARLVAEALHAVAHGGTALLIAEHRMDLLDGLCDRIVVLADGTIVRDGPAEVVLADPFLETLGLERPARHRIGDACRVAGAPLEPTELRRALGDWPHR